MLSERNGRPVSLSTKHKALVSVEFAVGCGIPALVCIYGAILSGVIIVGLFAELGISGYFTPADSRDRLKLLLWLGISVLGLLGGLGQTILLYRTLASKPRHLSVWLTGPLLGCGFAAMAGLVIFMNRITPDILPLLVLPLIPAVHLIAVNRDYLSGGPRKKITL